MINICIIIHFPKNSRPCHTTSLTGDLIESQFFVSEEDTSARQYIVSIGDTN